MEKKGTCPQLILRIDASLGMDEESCGHEGKEDEVADDEKVPHLLIRRPEAHPHFPIGASIQS